MNTVASVNLTVKKNSKIILDDLNFTLKPGTINGLIGPSGAGKTTLIRTIVGVQLPSSGSIEVLGLSGGDKELRSLIGYVTQSASIYPDLTVKQNLEYFGTLMQSNKSQIERVIKQVRLESQINQITSSLSGGQRARVSLAVALLGEPKLLVLDEPTVGLDPILRRDLWGLFRSIADSGRSLIVSSHVMDEAEKCDNLLLIREGRLLWSDSKNSLLHNQKVKTVEEAFLKLAGGREAK